MAFDDFISSLFGGGGGGNTDAQSSGGGGFLPDGGGGGGFDFGKMVLPLLIGGGGMLASRLLGGNDVDKAMATLNKIKGVTVPAGKQMVKRAAAGKLTDPQQAAVDRMKSEQNARWGQYLANLGIPVSSSAVQAQNLVDTQAQELAQKLINESFGQGLEALKLGGATSTQLLTNAMQQRQDTAKAIQEMMAQAGRVLNAPPGQPFPTQTPPTFPTTGASAWLNEGDPYANLWAGDVTGT